MGVPVYRPVTHEGSSYIIGSILFKQNLVEFIIDSTDLSGIQPYTWHYTSGALATTITDVSGKHEVYMHTLIMKPKTSEVVQHISGNGLDNRRTNLRCVDRGDSLLNRVQKKRIVELPPMCGLVPADIPRHIWYVQANGYHRDRFAIEFKTEKVLWKSTSSKLVSLKEKLEQAKAKLEELYVQYPHLNPAHEEERIRGLEDSFIAVLEVK
jgi:hypothetical protein